MRLKLFDKIVLVLLLLAGLGLAGFMLACCFISSWAKDFSWLIEALLTQPPFINRIFVGAGMLLLIFLILRILFVRRKPEGNEVLDGMAREAKSAQLLIKTGEHGQAFIQPDAFVEMVMKQIRANEKIRDGQAVIGSVTENGSVDIDLRILPLPDANLPSLSSELQADIKAAMEEKTGIQIGRVQVVFVGDANADAASTATAMDNGYKRTLL